jgi:hypothetical protein
VVLSSRVSENVRDLFAMVKPENTFDDQLEMNNCF